ncbi:hypothetical protein PMAYCL1PPCAC_20403 [Pristionchus mayeri]|uniref:Uncharacterized protein n=1 Tax=Pristionchus mayeri TaxID=1317129 RepID=A0AAN5CSZ0_9BILA|nr:hypothetical protein PMAYCL1PPCAC_20403 [Pristionchus mayeri]
MEMECPECEYRSNSLHGWEANLRNVHSTTPILAGFAFLCECGHECYLREHGLKIKFLSDYNASCKFHCYQQ